MIRKLLTTVAMLGTLAAPAFARDTITLGMVLEPPTLDPTAGAAAAIDEITYSNLFEGLTRFGPDGSVQPGLAERWDVSEGGRIYDFHLRQGVKFHDGADFAADDVVFSFERQGKDDHPWNDYVQGAAFEYYNSMSMPELVESVEKVDDMTVRFNLTRPEAPFLANMGMAFASIQSKEYADQLEAAGTMEQLNQQLQASKVQTASCFHLLWLAGLSVSPA